MANTLGHKEHKIQKALRNSTFAILLAFLLNIEVASSQQVSFVAANVSGGNPELLTTGIDSIFIADNLTDSRLVFSIAETQNLSAVYYTDQGVQDNLGTVNSSLFTVEGVKEGGYIFTYQEGGVDKEYVVWVNDYSAHTPKIRIDSAYVDDASPDINPCEEVLLVVQATRPLFMFYSTPTDGLTPFELKSVVSLAVENADTQTTISDGVVRIEAPNDTRSYTIEANQRFIFGGTQVSSNAYGSSTYTIDQYTPIAVSVNINARFDVGGSPANEIDGFSQEDRNVSGSVPLEAFFSSESGGIIDRYEWKIYTRDSIGDQLVTQFEGAEFGFVFQDARDYVVYLEVLNEECSSQDSIFVRGLETLLTVPNTFTPNGDGINDEFRVAYRSITSFRGVIFNRWGRKMFEWSDPAQGWDGKHKGNDCAPGAYFYRIEAIGNRGGEEVREAISGDINLLRSK